MKSKSHIHVANLILREIDRNGGRLTIKYGEKEEVFRLPEEIYNALTKYPSHFRAGAVGPDFFPDMFFGQMTIHPTQSGIWLKRMYDVLRSYNPSNRDYYPSLAFYLGYMTHYATDMFGHEDINKYAGGYFPSFGDILKAMFSKKEEENDTLANNPETRRLALHMAVESYMDSKLLDPNESFDIQIPVDYIRRCFATADTLQFMKDHHIKYNQDLSSLNPLAGLTEKYVESIRKSGTIGTYIKTIERRESLIVNWINEWAIFAQTDIDEGFSAAFDKCGDNLFTIILQFLLELINMDGVADAVTAFMDTFGAVADILLSVTTGGLNKIIDGVTKTVSTAMGALMKELFLAGPLHVLCLILGAEDPKNPTTSYNKAIKCLKDYFKNPEKLLNDRKISENMRKRVGQLVKEDDKFFKYYKENKFTFRAGNTTISMPDVLLKNIFKPSPTDYLDYKWGNYGKESDPFKQDYLQFERCLNMSKLCLLGANNLNRLVYDVMPDITENRYLFKGSNYVHGFYRLKVDIAMSDKYGAGTNADIMLRIVTNKNNIEHLLDKSGQDDFERASKDTYYVYLTSFLDASTIKSIEVFRNRRGAGDAYFDSVIVTDADTGILLAKSKGPFELNEKGDAVKLDLKGDIASSLSEETAPTFFQSPFIAGFYVYLHEVSAMENTMTLTVITKDGKTLSDTRSYKKVKSGRRTVFFSVSLNRKDIAKVYLSVSTTEAFNNIFLYDATAFYHMGGAFKPTLSSSRTEIPLNASYNEHYRRNGSKDWRTCRFEFIFKTAATSGAGTNSDMSGAGFYQNGRNAVPFVFDDPDVDNLESGALETFDGQFAEQMDVTSFNYFEIYKAPRFSSINDWEYEFIAIIDGDHGQTVAYYNNGGVTKVKGEATIKISAGYWKSK